MEFPRRFTKEWQSKCLVNLHAACLRGSRGTTIKHFHNYHHKLRTYASKSKTKPREYQESRVQIERKISARSNSKAWKSPGYAKYFITVIAATLCAGAFQKLTGHKSGTKVFDAPRFTTFTIVAREEVSSTSIILTLRPVAVVKEDPYKELWEKGTWSVEIKQPELQIARAYTPLPPRDGDAPGDLRFLIRKEHKGEMSGYLHGLRENANVYLRGPKAEFDLPANVTDIVFLAGGTGIAPALQIAYTLFEAREEPLPKVRIIWANRKREDCMGGHKVNGNTEQSGSIVSILQYFRKQYPDNVTVSYLVDEEGSFLDQKNISQMMNMRSGVKSQPIITKIDSKLLFVSGPDGFIDFLAGPKKWEGGKEEQGELGGVLGRMGIRDWKVWKM